MKIVPWVLLVLLACVLAIPHAQGQLGQERPPGVGVNAWIPMGDAAGFVVTGAADSRAKSLRNDRMAVPEPALKGYFAAKRGNAWYRIDTLPEPRLEPAQTK